MDYKEKYQEALDLARTFHDGYIIQGHNGEAGILEEIFSELKESEDEKIRKEIIDFLELPHHQFVGKRNHEKWIAWLENQRKKQGKSALEAWKDMRLEVYQQASGNRHEPNYSDDSTKMFSLNDIDEIIEKIGEQTHSDKIESKFKVGDWVIFNGTVAQIINKQKCGFVGLDTDGKDFFCNYGHINSMRLWTINDAKDGDVLSFYLEYKGNKMVQTGIIEKYVGKHGGCSNTFKVYVGVNWENNFQIGEYMGCSDIRPATKEQRDLLFAKMHDAGYEWDAEKKKLNRLVDSFPVKPVNEK